MHLDFKHNMLMLGPCQGKKELRNRESPEEHWLQVEAHDQDYGHVLTVSINSHRSHLVSSSADGTVRVSAIDNDTLCNQFKGMDYVESYKFIEPEQTLVNQIIKVEEDDTQDAGQYCLQ